MTCNLGVSEDFRGRKETALPMTPSRIAPGFCRLVTMCVLACGAYRAGPEALRAQDVVVSEFMASNQSTLEDEDGEFSDWLELHNPNPTDVSLDGWSLSDDAGDPRKWQLPAITLETGGYLLIFASGKDRASADGELHTNFKLSASGEYLGLARPDGSVAHEYSPEYPRQRGDISYGLAGEVASLIVPGGPADYHVPTSDALGELWTLPDFAPDASWEVGATGVGYQTGGDTGAPPPDGFWSFDESLEDRAGGHDGEFEGGASPSFVEGFGGPGTHAIHFDGQSEYVDLSSTGGEPLYNSPAYTIALWVKAEPQRDKRVYSEGSATNNNPLLTIGTDSSGATGKVDIFIRSNSSRSLLRHRLTEGVAFDGTWHHIAWVDREGSANVYIDGVRDAESFDYAREPLDLDVASIGAVLRSGPCCFFDGSIDDVAVWRRALNDDEIAILAAGISPGEGTAYTPLVETDVEGALKGVGSSIYLRLPFLVEDPSAFDLLTLRMKYDDGFVAYLGGVEVARAGAPEMPDWKSTATGMRSSAEAVVYENFDLTVALESLRPGENVLAIHGLNSSPDDESFLVLPELLASSSLGAEGRYFAGPSPGAANEGGTIDFVEDTSFSVDRGFYEDPIVVELTTETEGAEIRYTTDGSAPTPANGEVYSSPLLIERTTTLRAAAFKDGFQPTNVDTQTYIFLEDVIRQPNSRPGYPSRWQGWTADYGMDPAIATDTRSPHYAPTLKDDLKSLPTLSLVLDPDDLMGPTRGIYTHSLSRGVSWERAASIELIHPDGEREDLQVNCGVRMQGGSSARPGEGKHAFRLLFKDEYGPTKLRYRLFEDSKVDRFDTIILRCFSTDSWHFKDGGSRYRRWDSQFIRDMWMKDSQLAMGQLSGHNTYVHLYLNGFYWGLYNPSERPDDSFNALHQGGEKEDWDVVKDFAEVFRGNGTAWNDFMSQSNASLRNTDAYQRLQGNHPDGTRNPDFPALLDVDNLIDYMILHFYGCSEDWPHHNWYAARNRSGTEGWKFFVWDQEIVMDFQFRNRISVSNANSPAHPYSRLRTNADFRMRFADRVQKHLFEGGALTNEEARRRWMARANEIDRAVIAESARWGDYRVDVKDPSNSPAELYTRDHWLTEQSKVLEEYIPRSHALAMQRFEQGGLYPGVSVPTFSQPGGRIPGDFVLMLTAPIGTVYYSLDGSDPRLPGGAISPDALVAGATALTTVLAADAAATYLVPGDGGLGLDWTASDFDDAAWTEATSAIGYERSSGFEDDLSTDVETAMHGVNSSIYLRVPFEIEDPAAYTVLTLRLKYDDGFVAYLNGREVASHNAPETAEWNSRATTSHGDSDAQLFLEFDITTGLDALLSGTNILAIHGLNASVTSSDFLIVPELVAGRAAEQPGIPLSETTIVNARALHGGEWSALAQATFIIDEPLELRITEIAYHPHDAPADSPHAADDFEFLELQNVGTRPLALVDVKLTGGVEFAFPTDALSWLDPGEVVLVVKDLEAFEERYDARGLYIAGEYEGNLANGGDDLTLENALGETVLSFSYDDGWYPETDGRGASLVIVDALGDPSTWGAPESWTASVETGGTPGFHPLDDPPPGGLQRIGDANQDGGVDISDAVSFLRFLFAGGRLTLPCEGDSIDQGGNLALLDINADGRLDVADPVTLLGHLFSAGPPPARGPGCVRIEGCPDVCVR